MLYVDIRTCNSWQSFFTFFNSIFEFYLRFKLIRLDYIFIFSLMLAFHSFYVPFGTFLPAFLYYMQLSHCIGSGNGWFQCSNKRGESIKCIESWVVLLALNCHSLFQTETLSAIKNLISNWLLKLSILLDWRTCFIMHIQTHHLLSVCFRSVRNPIDHFTTSISNAPWDGWVFVALSHFSLFLPPSLTCSSPCQFVLTFNQWTRLN